MTTQTDERLDRLESMLATQAKRSQPPAAKSREAAPREKTRRPPTARNLFMGDCLREEVKETKRPVTELMGTCSVRWKQIPAPEKASWEAKAAEKALNPTQPTARKKAAAAEGKEAESADNAACDGLTTMVEWAQNDGKECKPCVLIPSIQWYKEELKDAGHEDLATALSEAIASSAEGEEGITIATKMDDIKKAVPDQLRKRLLDFDCATQTYSRDPDIVADLELAAAGAQE